MTKYHRPVTPHPMSSYMPDIEQPKMRVFDDVELTSRGWVRSDSPEPLYEIRIEIKIGNSGYINHQAYHVTQLMEIKDLDFFTADVMASLATNSAKAMGNDLKAKYRRYNL